MIFLAVIMLTCAVNLGCSVTVELYSGLKYYGLLKKITLNPDEVTHCIQFDQTYEVRSLKTEKCIMIYESENCSRIDAPAEGSKMYSVRAEWDIALFGIEPAYSNRQEERGVKSFRLCGTEPGAGLLNVDIYSGPSYTGDLVASYGVVCNCKNIPSYMSNGLKGKPFSIDNHGKNMFFYDQENCNGKPRLILAGDNEMSRSVFNLDDARAVVIRSFRHADLFCPNLDAVINKFTFSMGEYRNYVKQNTTVTMTNRQDTTVRDYINLNDSVTAEYTVAEAFTSINTTRVKAGFVMESKGMITSVLGSTLKDSLEAYYQYPNTNQNAATIVTKSVEGQLSEMPVDKPACTTCTVNKILGRFQGYPIRYTAEAIVTGMADDDKVTAERIRYFLPPGMKYVKDYDDYSVVVTVEGKMKGSRDGYSSEMSCVPLPDCEPDLKVDL